METTEVNNGSVYTLIGYSHNSPIFRESYNPKNNLCILNLENKQLYNILNNTSKIKPIYGHNDKLYYFAEDSLFIYNSNGLKNTIYIGESIYYIAPIKDGNAIIYDNGKEWLGIIDIKTKTVRKQLIKGSSPTLIEDNIYYTTSDIEGFIHLNKARITKSGKIMESIQLFNDIMLYEDGLYISPNGKFVASIIAREGNTVNVIFDLDSETIIEERNDITYNDFPFYDFKNKKIHYYNQMNLTIK
jgi:hypothetical protein